MTKHTKRMLMWWGVVICCAVFLGWSVSAVRQEWGSACGRMLNKSLVHSSPRGIGFLDAQYWVIEYQGEARLFRKGIDLWPGEGWETRGGIVVNTSPWREGFWALTHEQHRVLEYVPITMDAGAKRVGGDALQELLDVVAQLECSKLGSTSRGGLFAIALDHPPDYESDGILWSGYIHNAIAILSLLGFLVGTPMALLSTRRWVRERKRNRQGCCKSCGYSLAGLPDESPCPECGGAADEVGQQ